jgi:hypothetical protein
MHPPSSRLSHNSLGLPTSQGLAAQGPRGSARSPGSLSLVEATEKWLKSLYSSNSSQNEENYNKKAARFLVRGFRGVSVGMAKGFRFRWFVLTESNEAISAGLDFGKAFHKFVVWLRYYCADFQYIVVEHKKPRRHWHLITYGSDKLPVDSIRDYWRKHYLSTVTGMAEIKSIEKAMYYVCGYLKKGGKLARSWSSRDWVFPRWLGFSREYSAAYGVYPSAEVLVELALSSKARRKYELDWLVETGELSEVYLGKGTVQSESL